MEEIIEKIKDLQHLVRELAIDYFCFDAKILLFYSSDPYKVLSMIDENSLKEFVDNMKDMIEYYELDEDDTEILISEVNSFLEMLSKIIKK